jgi:hypothetical protein
MKFQIRAYTIQIGRGAEMMRPCVSRLSKHSARPWPARRVAGNSGEDTRSLPAVAGAARRLAELAAAAAVARAAQSRGRPRPRAKARVP